MSYRTQIDSKCMYDLALRPTVIDGNHYRYDYTVVWKSPFGERRVGRIRRADSGGLGPVTWVYYLQANIPVPPSANGRASSLKEAEAAFRKSFGRFCDDADDLSKAFRSAP